MHSIVKLMIALGVGALLLSYGKDASALKADYRADRFAFGRTEYDWALHNNLRLDTSAIDLFNEAEPIIVDSREQMIALARDVAKSHKWKTPIDGPNGPMIGPDEYDDLFFVIPHGKTASLVKLRY